MQRTEWRARRVMPGMQPSRAMQRSVTSANDRAAVCLCRPPRMLLAHRLLSLHRFTIGFICIHFLESAFNISASFSVWILEFHARWKRKT